jgi:Protein of unknown function (DUF2726)
MDTIDALLPSLFFIAIFGGIFLLVILSFIVKIKRPYVLQEKLMTQAEVKFFNILRLATENQYDIFAQVRLANIITIKQSAFAKYFWDHFRPIGMKSIDFVLCDKNTSKILLTIELDDYTHNLTHRIRRDQFVDDALKTANVAIFHQKVQSWYNVQELKENIARSIKI